MTKIRAYHYLTNTNLSWIANVFLTRGGKDSAKLIKALVKLHQKGIEVSSLSFTMPTEQLLVDGKVVTPAELLEIAK